MTVREEADSDPLLELYGEIESAISDQEMECYPAYLVMHEKAVEAPWLGEWQNFLGVAKRHGVKLIYLGLRYAPSSASGLLDEDEFGTTADEHAGHASALGMAFSLDGIVHTWEHVADWERVRAEAGTVLADADEQRVAEIMVRADAEDWVLKIARDPRYRSLKPGQWPWEMVRRIAAELSGERFDSPVAAQLANKLSLSVRLNMPVIKDELKDEARRRIPEFAQELIAADPDWFSRRVGVREQAARDLIRDRYGIPMPFVVQEVARWTPQSN